MPGGSVSSGSTASGGGSSEASMLPSLQHGRWAWTGLDGEACGDPLERFRTSISRMYDAAPRLGCTAKLFTPTPSNTLFGLDCPADASEGGVSVQKGKLEISVYAPSPQSVRVSTKAPGGPTEIFEAKRLGDC